MISNSQKYRTCCLAAKRQMKLEDTDLKMWHKIYFSRMNVIYFLPNCDEQKDPEVSDRLLYVHIGYGHFAR